MAINSEVNKEELKNNYNEALKNNTTFRKIVKTINAKPEVAMKYTSSLEETAIELTNCHDCPGLIYCKNRLEGHIFYPNVNKEQIIFSYVPCHFTKEQKKAIEEKNNRDKDLLNATFKDVDITDKKRVKVIKWLKEFCDNYNKAGYYKGLYLHGNFGCGKTYLISALFNELSKKRINTEIVYYPELLREIKSDFDTYGDRINYLEDVDLLLIDDIGAEKVTEWSRDEILGTILQKRMNNYKTTFFTSNLNMEELERHLRINSYSDDEIKARRIIERIKQLTVDMEMISENKRK